MLKQGQQISIRAKGVDGRGDGFARLDSGQRIYVPGLLAGELAIVTIEHISRQTEVVRGRLHQLREPNPDRQRPPCRHQGKCSGCPLMIATGALQRRLKREMVQHLHGMVVDELVCLPEGDLGYRWSCKRVVGGERGRIRLGSYVRGSHHVADMGACLVDHPDIRSCAQEVEQAANKLGIEPYDEQQATGDLRYVWFKTDGAGQVLVTLITAEGAAAGHSRAGELAEALTRPAGVAQCAQSERGNVIRGTQVTQLRGAATLTVELSGERVVVGPLGFLQPNPPVAALAYEQLVGTGRGELAIDLYAGTGITTALLRKRFTEVVPCEADEASAQALGVAPQRAEDLLATILADPDGPAPELVIANPPRAGLGETVCAQLDELATQRGAPDQLRIMSCSPAAMARDVKRLTGNEHPFRLVGTRVYDTLPNTAHVELVSWLERKKANPR
ncbi:MAG: class I SAM-dependent RNA methyltransferase [Deltaproteobacteria bacterium]|nr:class I SAM-dependent RNA methyltransferase [Deltaproteobacteria bacterium]